MARKRRLTESHDNVGWIAYTDFFTALALVFIALFVITKVQSSSEVTIVEGDIKNAEEDLVSDCEVKLDLDSIQVNATRFTRSNREGGFNFVVDGLKEATESKVTARCPSYDSVSAEVTLVSGNRHQVPLEVGSRRPGPECYTPICWNEKFDSLRAELRRGAGIEIDTIPGSALFSINSSVLTPEGKTSMRDLAKRLQNQELLSDTTKVLAILGHTDDVPFPAEIGGDSVDYNWTLSAQRAAAAAQFLISDSIGGNPEYKCRIVAMGFGPSRPLEPVDTLLDADATQRRKRARNRRLEFRVLNGSDLSASPPSDC